MDCFVDDMPVVMVYNYGDNERQEYYCECDEELGADFKCHKTLS